MANLNVLVKDLQGVETLGAITLLATDKTGTLTRNQMTASYVWTNLKLMRATRQVVGNEVVADITNSAVKEIAQISILCSRAKFASDDDKEISERKIMGDATESGLLRFAYQFLPYASEVVIRNVYLSPF
jgi:sodium/potassium-transporting ATPase subunit alpha